MINALHLLWIIPMSAAFGYFIAALCMMASAADNWEERKNE